MCIIVQSFGMCIYDFRRVLLEELCRKGVSDADDWGNHLTSMTARL